MDNPMELEKVNGESPREGLSKWLRSLFYIHIICTAAAVVSWLPIPDGWLTWLQRIFIAGAVFCLFQLTPASPRYRKAAIFRAVYLGGILVNALVFSSTALMLTASVCSLLSVYQEYSAHSELVADLDPKLSRQWHSLFNWSIGTAVLVSLGSTVLSVVSVLIGMDVAAVVSVVRLIISLPDFIVDIFYLLYLNRTVQLVQNKE